MYLLDLLRIPAEMREKRLENITALHLYKACQYWTDTARGEYELRFVRDKTQTCCIFSAKKNQSIFQV